jgi:CRP/FNR family transcriptional regulator, dissimilatory nitrate respiration regulator
MMLHTLRRAPMFSGLPADSLQRLLDGCRLLKLDKDEVLFHEGGQADGFFVVHSGAINVHRLAAGGREQVIRVFYPGEAFGEVVLADATGYPASAVATEASQVILIQRDFFRRQIQGDPDLALRILASMSLHLRFLVETVEDLKLKQAESRLAQWLLRNAGTGGQAAADGARVPLPVAKRLLASQLGITPETFSRVLARWRDDRTVVVDGPVITVLSVAALRAYLA